MLRVDCKGDDIGEVNVKGSYSSGRDGRSSSVAIVDRREDHRLGVAIAWSSKILLCLDDDSMDGEALLEDLISLAASRVTTANSDD